VGAGLQRCRLVQLRIRSWLRTIYPYSLGFTHHSLAMQGGLSGDAGCAGLVDVADAELGLLFADALAD